MKILNLTMHSTTPEQAEAGVVEPKDKEKVKDILTFNELPSKRIRKARAKELAEIPEYHDVDAAMIGGAPFLMPRLEFALINRGISPCYAFSTRESVEETKDDGSVVKKNVFRHQGLVWV